MMKSMKVKLMSTLIAGSVVIGSLASPAMVMACDFGGDYNDYGYIDCYDLTDDEIDELFTEYIIYEAIRSAYEEEHRYVNVTGVCVSSTAVQLPAGGRYQITGYVKPDNANNQGVCYYSTNPMIATVDGNGVITALNPGTCTIVTKTSEGGFEAYTCMTVLPAATLLSVIR